MGEATKVLNDFYVLGGGVFLKVVGGELEIEVHSRQSDVYSSRQHSTKVPLSRLKELVDVLDPKSLATENERKEMLSTERAELDLLQRQKRNRELRELQASKKEKADAPTSPPVVEQPTAVVEPVAEEESVAPRKSRKSGRRK